MFAAQFRDRLDVARALALLRYVTGEPLSDRAKVAIQFQRPTEQELMYVVSKLTTRSEHFLEQPRQTDGGRVFSDTYRRLDEIVF